MVFLMAAAQLQFLSQVHLDGLHMQIYAAGSTDWETATFDSWGAVW